MLGYLEDGEAEISNNRIEGKNIRKFVIRRKNFVAIDTVAGANASAICYGLVITAWENGLNVYEYLKHSFEELPKRRKEKDAFCLEAYLPWSASMPDRCYLKPPAPDKDSERQLVM